MYEYENRRRPSHNEIPVRGSVDVAKHDFFLTGFQIIACIICLLAAIVIKQFGGGFYDTTKVYVTQALSKSITNEQVSQVFANIGKALPSAKEIFSSGAATSSSSSTASKQSTSSSTASSSSNSSKSTSSVSIPNGASAESLDYSFK